MPGNQPTQTVISFGPFEADLQTQELRKQGVRLRLPGQSFQILKMLLERPGRLVTREELHKALWPSETFVDFEHGVNAAVNRLREVLGDSADSPQLIETLPRRGYRFIGKIDVPPKPVGDTNVRPAWLKVAAWILAAASCVSAAVLAYLKLRPRIDPAAMTPIPFTAYPGLEDCPTFSPDGSQIAFAWDGGPGPGSKGFDLYVKVIGSENLLRLTHHPSEFICPAWSPDGTQIAFHRMSGVDTGVYVVPALGGPERKLRSTRIPFGISAPISWSPNGKWIAYVESLPPLSSERIYLLSVETLESRQIPHEESCIHEGLPAFSHSGQQLAYTCLLKSQPNEGGLYYVATPGGPPRLIKTFTTGKGLPTGLAWTAHDTKLILSRPKIDENDFELDEVALADGSLRKLPFGQNGMSPVISPNGDKLAYATYSNPDSDHVDIWRKDLLKPQSPAVKLISSTHQQITPAYSPDGKHIAFESTRGGVREVWMSDADGTHLVQISNFKHPLTGTPRWSPDSQKIVFDSRQSGDAKLYIVDVSELMPRKVATNVPNISMPSWSHDGKWIYFFSESLDGAKVYRCPANGGDAVLLAALPRGERGIGPVESFDGKSVYFAKQIYDTELYTVSIERAGNASVLKGMPLMKYAFLWTVAPGGVYFVPAGAPKSLRYFDFSTKQVRQIFEIDKEFYVGLSVSPDGRWLLYTQVEAEENSDIMLIENFR